MNPKLIYPILLGVLISLIPIANVNASEIAELSSNSTDTNTTTTSNTQPPTPICDEWSEPGQLCRDEGDYLTCDPGFRDTGNGCKPFGKRAECSNKPGSAGLKFPQDDLTECNQIEL